MATTKLMTYSTLCERYGFAPGTARRLVFEKNIPFVRLAPRTVLFEPEEIDAWIANHRSVPKGVKR